MLSSTRSTPTTSTPAGHQAGGGAGTRSTRSFDLRAAATAPACPGPSRPGRWPGPGRRPRGPCGDQPSRDRVVAWAGVVGVAGPVAASDPRAADRVGAQRSGKHHRADHHNEQRRRRPSPADLAALAVVGANPVGHDVHRGRRFDLERLAEQVPYPLLVGSSGLLPDQAQQCRAVTQLGQRLGRLALHGPDARCRAARRSPPRSGRGSSAGRPPRAAAAAAGEPCSTGPRSSTPTELVGLDAAQAAERWAPRRPSVSAASPGRRAPSSCAGTPRVPRCRDQRRSKRPARSARRSSARCQSPVSAYAVRSSAVDRAARNSSSPTPVPATPSPPLSPVQRGWTDDQVARGLSARSC